MADILPYVQTIKLGDVEFDLVALASLTYIESIDTGCPKLIIKINDRHSYIRDDIGLKVGHILKVELGNHHGDQPVEVKEFTVLTMPYSMDGLTINCLATKINNLKTPTVNPIFFPKQSPDLVLKSLVGADITLNGAFPVTMPYHLNSGVSASRLIKKICRENAAVFHLTRNGYLFSKIKSLMIQPPLAEYVFGNRSATYQIQAFKVISVEAMQNRELKKKYSGWNMKTGEINNGSPMEYSVTAIDNQQVIDNLNDFLLPVLEFECLGNDNFEAGKTLAVAINRNDIESVLDESIPAKMIIMKVSHYQEKTAYLCKVLLGIPNVD